MRDWLSRIRSRGVAIVRDPDAGFLFISGLVGVTVGLGAVVLIWSLEIVGKGVDWLREVLPGYGRWIVLFTVPVGILIAWWLARRFAPEVEGDGVAEVTGGLALRGGYISTKSIPVKILATALTLGSGGSGGREGPIVYMGGGIGSSIARHFGLGEDRVRSLLAAGAAAGIGASFNAPIAGMLFALEVILGSFAVQHMSAVVVASIAAAVTFRSLVPDAEILQAGSYTLGSWNELFIYAGLAVVAVVAAVMFLRLLSAMEDFSHRTRHRPWTRPLLFGLVVGGLGVWHQEILGTGHLFTGDLLRLQVSAGTGDILAYSSGMLLLFSVLKILATSFTISSGGSGGAFMPSLFIGATLGAGYAQLINEWGVVDPVHPGAFAVVGMATMFAAVARAPLTAILIVFEVTGADDYGLVLPLMLAATFATVVADRVHPESVYTMPLSRRGIKIRRTSDVDLLQTVTVGDSMTPNDVIARPDMTLREVDELMEKHSRHGLPVVDSDGRLAGLIAVADIRRAGGVRDDLNVGAAMTARPATISPSAPVSVALERMAVLGVGRLPVVDDQDRTRLVGMFRREDAVRAYHRALGASTDFTLEKERFLLRTEPGSHYYEFRIPPGSMADGRAVREIAWPEGSTLVSVRRGTEILIPSGSTVLQRDDVVTAFGEEGSRARVIERLNATGEEPTAELLVVQKADTGEGS